MNATLSLDVVWNIIYNLVKTLSNDNKKWLADKLYESAATDTNSRESKLVFPKISKDRQPSPEILAMTLGAAPEGFDFEAEKEKVLEELAK